MHLEKLEGILDCRCNVNMLLSFPLRGHYSGREFMYIEDVD